MFKSIKDQLEAHARHHEVGYPGVTYITGIVVKYFQEIVEYQAKEKWVQKNLNLNEDPRKRIVIDGLTIKTSDWEIRIKNVNNTLYVDISLTNKIMENLEKSLLGSLNYTDYSHIIVPSPSLFLKPYDPQEFPVYPASLKPQFNQKAIEAIQESVNKGKITPMMAEHLLFDLAFMSSQTQEQFTQGIIESAVEFKKKSAIFNGGVLFNNFPAKIQESLDKIKEFENMLGEEDLKKNAHLISSLKNCLSNISSSILNNIRSVLNN